MTHKPIKQPERRTQQDAVTGELVTVELTPARLAAERCIAALDRERLTLSTGDVARMLEIVYAAMAKMAPHTT